MRKEMILDVAYDKFCERGYNVTLTEIAKAAGIKKQSLYNYFESKDELFYELIVNKLNLYFSTKEKEVHELKGIKPEEKLKAIFFIIINGFIEDLPRLRFWRWLLLIESVDMINKTKEILIAYETEFKSIIEELVIQTFYNKSFEEQNKILQTYMVLLHGTLDSILYYNVKEDAKKLAENVWEVFWARMNISSKINE